MPATRLAWKAEHAKTQDLGAYSQPWGPCPATSGRTRNSNNVWQADLRADNSAWLVNVRDVQTVPTPGLEALGHRGSPCADGPGGGLLLHLLLPLSTGWQCSAHASASSPRCLPDTCACSYSSARFHFPPQTRALRAPRKCEVCSPVWATESTPQLLPAQILATPHLDQTQLKAIPGAAH